MNKIEKLDLLLLDDFALQPFDAFARSTLMEMVEDRHGKKSTVVASQIPVALWHSMIGEETVADAIMDRLVHDAHRLALMGESLRKRRKMVAETDEQSNESIM
ncbi:MAG TPA: ATP-binding protein, partial [Bacteroidales bacterium]|nr:ATP-binding protein [Bacteroidales bacterium]